jgi:hypothetical protein
MEHMRAKPGEAMTRTLQEREARLRRDLAKIDQQRKTAREKATGKTRAQGYTRKWLEALTATELKHEVEVRGYMYASFDTMEEAIDVVLAAMFAGIVVESANGVRDEGTLE